MSDAIKPQNADAIDQTAVAAITGGQIAQMPDGRAGVFPSDVEAGRMGSAAVVGIFTVTKAASQVWLDGARIYWDHSADAATCIPQFADKDFYIGVAVGDTASAATTGRVNLNVQPNPIIDLHRDAGDVVPVLTAGTPFIGMRGGALDASFSATAEAQKLDWLSKRSFPVTSNWILEAVFEVVTTADADVADLSIGVANASHASDADAITESALFHADLGADLNLDAESDDGTTEVAATDTTVDLVAGTPVLVALDGRDESDVLYYVNGVERLNATADLGNIEAATGPLKALFHLEKSSNDTLCHVRLHSLTVRLVGNE